MLDRKSRLSAVVHNNRLYRRSPISAFPKKTDYAKLVETLLIQAGFALRYPESLSFLSTDFPDSLAMKSFFHDLNIVPATNLFDLLKSNPDFFAKKAVVYFRRVSPCSMQSDFLQNWHNLAAYSLDFNKKHLIHMKQLERCRYPHVGSDVVIIDTDDQFYIPDLVDSTVRALKKKNHVRSDEINFVSLSTDDASKLKRTKHFDCYHLSFEASSTINYDVLNSLEQILRENSYFDNASNKEELDPGIWVESYPEQGLDSIIGFLLNKGCSPHSINVPSFIHNRDPFMTFFDFLLNSKERGNFFLDVDWFSGKMVLILIAKDQI